MNDYDPNENDIYQPTDYGLIRKTFDLIYHQVENQVKKNFTKIKINPYKKKMG